MAERKKNQPQLSDIFHVASTETLCKHWSVVKATTRLVTNSYDLSLNCDNEG